MGRSDKKRGNCQEGASATLTVPAGASRVLVGSTLSVWGSQPGQRASMYL